MRKNSKKTPKLILEFFDFMEKYFFQVKYEKKIQRNSSYFFENKIIFILKYLGAKNCHFRWLHIFKVIGKSIADHDRDRRSWDFQNMIVSDCRSQFGKMIVSDRRSQKKVSSLTLLPTITYHIHSSSWRTTKYYWASIQSNMANTDFKKPKFESLLITIWAWTIKQTNCLFEH